MKAKTSLLCLRYECAYEVEDNFNELIQHIELESISKDSSDAAICMGCQSSNRSKYVLKKDEESTEGKDGEQARMTHAMSTASAIKHILFCSYPVLCSRSFLYHKYCFLAHSLFHLVLN